MCPGQGSCGVSGLSGEGTVGTCDPHGDIVVLVASFLQGLEPKGLLGSLNSRGGHDTLCSNTEQHTCLPALSESIMSGGLQASSVSLTQELLESLGTIIDSLFLQSQSPMSAILKPHVNHIQVIESWKRIEFTRVFVCFKNYRVNAGGQVLIFKPNLEMLRQISG